MKRLRILKQLRSRSSTESNVPVRPERVARGPAALPRNECWKMVESCEETIALEESVENPRKLEETFGKMRKL